MIAGNKIAHRHFDDGEYLFMNKEDMVENESTFCYSWNEWWQNYINPTFDTNWFIYEKHLPSNQSK